MKGLSILAAIGLAIAIVGCGKEAEPKMPEVKQLDSQAASAQETARANARASKGLKLPSPAGKIDMPNKQNSRTPGR